MQIEHMNDEEVLEYLMEAFEEDGRLNMNYIDIEVADGSITVSGRVMSEEELQVIGEIMTETLEIEVYKNKVWIDESLSYEDPEDNSPDLKDLSFDDDDIDDQEYVDDEESEDEF